MAHLSSTKFLLIPFLYQNVECEERWTWHPIVRGVLICNSLPEEAQKMCPKIKWCSPERNDYGCRRHCPQCNKTQTNECCRLWSNIPPPRANLPVECTPPGKCEDVCCSNRNTNVAKSNEDRICFNCDHVPPPQLRFNYSTRDGEHDPKSNLAIYETTTNKYHGRKPLMDLMEYHDPSNMRTPRFLEICPTSLRFRDQRP